jgi:hypothetical protein
MGMRERMLSNKPQPNSVANREIIKQDNENFTKLRQHVLKECRKLLSGHTLLRNVWIAPRTGCDRGTVIDPNEISDETSSGVDFHRRSLVLLEDDYCGSIYHFYYFEGKYRNVLQYSQSKIFQNQLGIQPRTQVLTTGDEVAPAQSGTGSSLLWP